MNEYVKDGFTGMVVSEERIRSVMLALDLILDDPNAHDDDWDTHLRRIAVAAIEAGKIN